MVARVMMIGNAHIDPVWLWTVEEGRREVLSSYRTAIALIAEYPGYVFTSGGALTYRWVEEDDPVLFAAIRRAVQQGRWALVNGWWLQPDCNLPNGESFARHALYGQRYLLRAFGAAARVGYNVDSFGHANTLPQLLRLSGLEDYVFFRPGPGEKALPSGPFWWEAPGGARVLACRPPLHYCSPDDADIAARISSAAAEALPDFPLVMCFYGVGNHGGGPTRRSVEGIIHYGTQADDIRPVFAHPLAYFREARAADRQWPVVRDDLQHHARGCYSALSRVKRENREAERALMGAERWSALATMIAEMPDRRPALAEAWHGVLFNQFHDILAGTCIRRGYEDVWRQFERARSTAAAVQEEALGVLVNALNVPDGPGTPVVVWNPLPWERTEAVDFAIPFHQGRHDAPVPRLPVRVVLQSVAGRTLPCQVEEVVFDDNAYVARGTARVRVPGLGARLLYARVAEGEPVCRAAAMPADTITNDLLALRVDAQTGWITSLYDRASACELLAEPIARALVIADPSDTWSHDIASFREVVGTFAPVEPPRLVRDGPVCQSLLLRLAWERSTLEERITLYRHDPWVEIALTVDWHAQHKMLKIAFPLALRHARVTASTPYGWIVREPNGCEEPCQEWLDVSGDTEAGPRGWCVLNDGKYSYDALGGELRLTALRSPIYAFHQPRQMAPGVTYLYTDQGVQAWRYRLRAHSGQWAAARPVHAAYALHEPLLAHLTAPHAGASLPASAWSGGSLLRLEEGSAILTVVKLAEDAPQLLVRGYETQGRQSHVVLHSDALHRTWRLDVGPHEIWTYRLPLDGGALERVDLLERPLSGGGAD